MRWETGRAAFGWAGRWCAGVVAAGGLVLAMAAPALALEPPQVATMTAQSVRPAGVGGAFVAGAAGNGALRSNAGGLAAVHLYALEATYGRATEAGPSAWGVSIVDSKTNPALAGGISYSRGSVGGDTTEKQDDYASQQIRLGLGLPLVEGALTLGATGSYTTLTTPKIADDQPGSDLSSISVDAGLHGVLSKVVLIGLTGRNLIESESMGLKREVAAGLGLMFGPLLVSGAWEGRPEQGADGAMASGYAAGLEFSVETVPLRVGFRQEPIGGGQMVTGGIGWRSRESGLDLAFEQPLEKGAVSNVSVSMSIYL